MASLTLEQIRSMLDDDDNVDKLAMQFLVLFEEGKPLQEEPFKKWKARHGITAERIKMAAQLALESGWILEESSGIYLTIEGTNKRDAGR
jgi:hypothetical protein